MQCYNILSFNRIDDMYDMIKTYLIPATLLYMQHKHCRLFSEILAGYRSRVYCAGFDTVHL